MDIEGNEWEALNTSIADGSLLKVKQLAFEIHTDELTGGVTPVYKLRHYLDLYAGLRDLGFYKWYVHRNPQGKGRTNNTVWCCYEFVYFNINYL